MSDQDISIGKIANFFGTRMGSMSLDRIITSYRLDEEIPQGNKTERCSHCLEYFYSIDDEKIGFIGFFNTLLDRHQLTQNNIDELNSMLDVLGFEIIDGKLGFIEDEDEFSRFIRECMVPSQALPGDSGKGDGAMITIIDRLGGTINETVVVDFGCGNGRLLYELETLDSEALELITYVAVDIDQDCLDETERNLISLGLDSKLSSFYSYTTDDFFESDILADYVFMANVLHEIPLISLNSTILGIESRLKDKSVLLIHELQEIVEGELRFISWDPPDFQSFFKNTSLRCVLHPYSSRSGIKFVNATCVKIKTDPTDDILYNDNMIQMLRRKVERINSELREIYDQGVRNRRFAYLLVLKYNIEIQISELEEIESSEIDLGSP